MLVYIGTYTNRGSEGVYAAEFGPESGTLGDLRVAARLKDPTWVTPTRRGAGCSSATAPRAAATAWSARSRSIRRRARSRTSARGRRRGARRASSPSTRAAAAWSSPTTTARSGRGAWPSSASARRADLTQTDLLRHEGSGPNERRQECSHPHSVNIDPTGRYVLVPDLGIDRVVIYRMDAARASLRRVGEAAVEPGSGPRHLRFDPAPLLGPAGWRAHLINELGNTLMVFHWDAWRGTLRHLQTLPTLPDDFAGRSTCAEVRVHPSGRFVYGSNRGHDSIAMFAVDEATGGLISLGQEPTGGGNPRGFTLDPSGTWLLAGNQDSDNVVTFRIDPATGMPGPTGAVAEVPAPVCLLLWPEGARG